MDSYKESKKTREDDFEELMAACNTAKEASKNGKTVESGSPMPELAEESSLSKLAINDAPPPPRPITPKITVEKMTESRDKDNLRNSSSFDSEPVTVVEKDDNGFVYYKCRFCGFTFNYMNTLRAHERIHGVSQPHVCGKCGESFEFACQLEYHTLQHSDTKGYKCECGRTFYSYTEMLYHKHPEDMDKEKTEKLYGAPMLATTSSSNPLSLTDLPIPEFAEKGFEPKHPMKVYNDVRTKPYICEYCSKSYSDSRGLAYHMYSHRGEKMFNPRASRYLIGRQGVGYTDRSSYYMFPRTSGYTNPLY